MTVARDVQLYINQKLKLVRLLTYSQEMTDTPWCFPEDMELCVLRLLIIKGVFSYIGS